MDVIIVLGLLVAVILLYFKSNPLNHSKKFIMRRFINWFPLGMSYAFLYMARYNLVVSKNALGSLLSKEDFGIIFAAGTTVYGFSFLLNGPLVDKIGGKKGIILACLGACIANVLMGIVTFLYLHNRLIGNLTFLMSILYAANMFFQSYGAVSIIKVKAYWFHVRERGVFGAIFGTLISVGVYFAFDWGQKIVDASKLHIAGEMTLFQKFIQITFAVDTGTTDAYWLVFFIPAFILVFWALIDMWLIKDTPGEANHEDFDTHDASSGEEEGHQTILDLLKRIFTNPIMYTLASIDLAVGVLKNGIMQWYAVFAKEVPQVGAEFFFKNWGLLLCIFGIIGGFSSGVLSDRVFHSRRGPPTAIMNGIMLLASIVLVLTLKTSPIIVGLCCSLIIMSVIGVQSIIAGTAAVDFGGRRAAATASGIVDGCIYLGGGLQSYCLGYLTTKDWAYWPAFLVPFAVIGMILAMRIWKDIPDATKKYLAAKEGKNL